MNKPILQPVSIPIQESTKMVRQEEDGVELATYLCIVYDNRWLIIGIALIATLLAAANAFMNTPVYEANMLIHVEEEGNQNQSKNILGEMASTFDVKTSAMSEMELIRSRLVVSHAVDSLQLEIDAHPKYFPIIGAKIADRNKQLSTPGLFGFGGYAWGAEKIDVSIFTVPDSLVNRNFLITAEGNGQFRLNERGQKSVWKGQVGKTLSIETGNGGITLLVSQLAAKAGAQFLLRRTSRLATIEDVQKAMKVTEQGKQSGIISVTLTGKDPQLVSRTLSEIGRGYMSQNQARKTEEAEKSLNFLDKQLPEMKRQLEQSELKYNQFRNSHGTIDLSQEAKLSLEQSAAVKTKRLELQQRRTELLIRFTGNHPIVEGINHQISAVDAELKKIADHIKQLPMLEQEVLSLNREIKVNTDLYTALLNTAQQLRLITAGKVSNVRLVDAPMKPENPVKPRSEVLIALSMLVGLVLGLTCAIIKKAISDTLDDPDQIEKILGVQISATIPHSKNLKQLHEQASCETGKMPLLANVSSTDVAIESLRTFRTALQFSMLHSKNNIILMTGATSGLGKTFVSANLAAIVATIGKRVLLIDADLRNGHLNQYFGLTRQNGLSDFLSGKIRMEQAIHRDVIEHLDFISTGDLPLNPSELLLRPRFGELLQSLSSNYDLILLDTPPILALPDTLIVGLHAGEIYMMARAGVTTGSQIKESMKRLSQAGLSVKGILFNDLKPKPWQHSHGHTYRKYRQNRYSLEKKTIFKARLN